MCFSCRVAAYGCNSPVTFPVQVSTKRFHSGLHRIITLLAL